MDACLEPVDKLLSGIDDATKELAFALGFGPPDDPAQMRWLAACLAKRAQEIEGD